MQTNGAIVIGGHINGLGIIRSLAALNIATSVILTEPYDFTQDAGCEIQEFNPRIPHLESRIHF
jgi:hypothetical protein